MMQFANAEQALREALGHHQAGRIQQAAEIYQHVLMSNPDSAPAWHLLGIAEHQSGRSDSGAEMIERAIRIGQRTTESYNNLGECYRSAGKHQDAIRAY